ncbi:MAG: hemoblobin-interacting domain-containing protein [Dethiobacteria bacterium]|jgi:uncharacterized repeat protein (TIGR02059 family)
MPTFDKRWRFRLLLTVLSVLLLTGFMVGLITTGTAGASGIPVSVTGDGDDCQVATVLTELTDSEDDIASSEVNQDKQVFDESSGLNKPPVLTADTTKNIVGEPVEITFSDDESDGWSAAISSVLVNDEELTAEQYTVSSEKIILAVGVFTKVGDYEVLVKANGYVDASVTQTIQKSVKITGDGVENEKTFALTELEAMKDDEHKWVEARLYSSINTWPTKKWYAAEGVKLAKLLEEAGIKDEAQLITVKSADGYKMTFTKKQLLDDKRYYFLGLKENHEYFGQIPGSTDQKVLVDTILALRSVDSDNLDEITDENAPRLIFGQRWVTEQTNQAFAKYVSEIEVSTMDPEKWDAPTAAPAEGIVPVGTKVELSSLTMDADKIYYTTDGTDPSYKSLIYNWIAKRWWSSREDVLEGINKPIEITADTTIKAVTIGLGKEDSDIVTFEYRVALELISAEVTSDGNLNLICSRAVADSAEMEVKGQFTVLIDGQEVDVTAVVVDTNAAPEKILLELATKIEVGQDVTVSYTKSANENEQIKSSDGQVLQGFEQGFLGVPKLIADTTNNTVGSPIKITFEDDEGWRKAITGVTVNGTAVDSDKYTFEVGKIIFDADIFTAAGDYAVVVIATGYQNATLVQKITASSGEPGGPGEPGGEIVLEITGDGVTTPKKFTQAELEEMPQLQEVYSCINTWPTKKWYVGEGVALSYLLGSKQADIKPDATLIKFFASDGYYMTLTVQELLKDSRYRFPNFKEGGGDGDGHLPGSSKGAVKVETLLGLRTAEGTDDPSYMNDINALLLMPGQRAMTEQTGPLFVKNVNKIEVLTGSISQWDEPTAEPSGGTVPAGTKVRLSNIGMDQDKVHYTLDGSTPTLESPIYNWIARRWWSTRGEETVEKINRPIELTKDTTIKAITIGPGKEDSDVVTFTYKVTGTAPSTSDKITPGEGGTVSLGNDVVMEIPAGALTGTSAVEVKIERIEAPPAAPAGCKLLGDVYEFSIDGEKSYNFAKKVKIKFSFDPEALGKDETPAVHYYDEAQSRWINIGGKVLDNIISVEVDHLTKYGVMVSLPATVTATIKPVEGGKVNLGEEAIMEIPAGALAGSRAVEVKIERVKAPPAAPAGFKLLGDVFEFSIDGKKSYSFAKKVKIKLGFDSKALSKDEAPAVHYYDEAQSQWVDIGGTISDSIITVEVDHLTRFAVLAAIKQEKEQLTDIAGHWAYDNINKLVALGAISGYPDGSFKPDNNITRAEFATVLVKAFQLENKGGKTFADTAAHWAKEYIATAAAHGIVNGYDANTFGPDDLLTREQMAVMTIMAAKLSPAAGELRFADSSSISGWARSSLATAVKNGIINGYPDNTVRPQGRATRAEAVTVIAKVLDKKNK